MVSDQECQPKQAGLYFLIEEKKGAKNLALKAWIAENLKNIFIHRKILEFSSIKMILKILEYLFQKKFFLGRLTEIKLKEA